MSQSNGLYFLHMGFNYIFKIFTKRALTLTSLNSAYESLVKNVLFHWSNNSGSSWRQIIRNHTMKSNHFDIKLPYSRFEVFHLSYKFFVFRWGHGWFHKAPAYRARTSKIWIEHFKNQGLKHHVKIILLTLFHHWSQIVQGRGFVNEDPI